MNARAMLPRRLRQAALSGIAIVGWVKVGGEPSVLDLQELRSTPIQTEWQVAGGAIGPADRSLLWLSGRDGLRVITGRLSTVRCPGLRVLAAAFSEAGVMEAVTTQGRIHAVGVAGCQTLGTFTGRHEIVSAARTSTAWVATASDSNGMSRLLMRQPTGRTVDLSEAADADRLWKARTTRLAVAPAGILLASTRWPFSWHYFAAPAAWHFRNARPFASDTLLKADNDSARASTLVALSVLPLDDGFLQVLADPRSDLRVFVLYAQDGARTRVRSVSTAIGPLAADRTRRELLMLRRTDITEVVTYGWRWRSPSFPSQGVNP